MKYASLHMHTDKSILDGASTAEEYCQRAAELGIKTLASTDHSTLSGHREFYNACVKHDIQCILGVEAHLSVGSRHDKTAVSKRQDGEDSNAYYHLILLAKNDNGLKNLNRIEKEAWTTGFYGKPQIDMELLEEFGDDLIATSACVSGPIARNLINEDYDRANEWFDKLKGRFDDDFYVELQYHNEDISPGLNKQLIEMADKNDTQIIATMDTHHANPKNLWLQEAILILNTSPKKNPTPDEQKKRTGSFLDVFNHLYPDRKMTFETAEVCLMSGDYIHDKFVEQGIERPDLLTNTLKVADKIGN